MDPGSEKAADASHLLRNATLLLWRAPHPLLHRPHAQRYQPLTTSALGLLIASQGALPAAAQRCVAARSKKQQKPRQRRKDPQPVDKRIVVVPDYDIDDDDEGPSGRLEVGGGRVPSAPPTTNAERKNLGTLPVLPSSDMCARLLPWYAACLSSRRCLLHATLLLVMQPAVP